ncbi:hypothetical protein DM02DRAFT_365473 [Periconia macrospinosa]|uniref:Uncharacterized protein n=1 Tax=Periconia macrospinosa TaxID=97972 RepID=A0A2V1DV31_9PLEO|nr:hypothetical protein DM02DRAFT_365473 [Periconia macrospinosa]
MLTLIRMRARKKNRSAFRRTASMLILSLKKKRWFGPCSEKKRDWRGGKRILQRGIRSFTEDEVCLIWGAVLGGATWRTGCGLAESIGCRFAWPLCFLVQDVREWVKVEVVSLSRITRRARDMTTVGFTNVWNHVAHATGLTHGIKPGHIVAKKCRHLRGNLLES